ncbi:hypothetical protein NSK_002790 [Nannochloropsis salina CCMP1776]|nr:hypothetical protein NSK_002790 [Nannochloropsis salina CCMP1776]|eukprot:TFJ85970.1 hypothetical protein NSK_002790 [Nannochloropsis salina CCMP1776]
MKAIQNMLPGAQEESVTEEVCAMCPSLTYQQRMIGFVGCFCLGYLLSFIGTLSLISMTADGIRNFAALYVVGNIIALCSTGFLVGPKSQCKKMFDKTRRYSTILYIIMLIVVFAVALARQNVFLVLFLLIIQVLVAVWYTLSYVPFGRQAVVGCMQNTLFKPCPGAIAGMV